MKYFAYGSNMLSGRLRAPDRAPSAKRVGLGLLPDYDLRFQKLSSDGSSKCTVAPCGGRQVFGVIYDISLDEKPSLDRAEGLGHGYAEAKLVVVHERGPISVVTYIAQPDHLVHDLAPYTWYRDIVVAGARENRLPEPYIQLLLSTAATEDPDRKRGAANRCALSGR